MAGPPAASCARCVIPLPLFCGLCVCATAGAAVPGAFHAWFGAWHWDGGAILPSPLPSAPAAPSHPPCRPCLGRRMCGEPLRHTQLCVLAAVSVTIQSTWPHWHARRGSGGGVGCRVAVGSCYQSRSCSVCVGLPRARVCVCLSSIPSSWPVAFGCPCCRPPPQCVRSDSNIGGSL